MNRRPYNEMQVLKKLDIPDFRHLSKDKVIAFATMIPKMNPEVAKKALEQFPNFASTSLNVMKEYKSLIEELMTDDKESSQYCYDMYNRVMSALEQMLNQDDLTFEEKTYILSQMREVADEVAQKDSEKSNNRMKVISMVGGLAAGLITILGTAIGTNLVTKKNDILDDDDSERS